MEPLPRAPTRNSTLSWWSDRNPPGATISLHTLAKPLLKQLYHRQALGVIAARADSPLSKEAAEMLALYLRFKYISLSTRAVVLGYLSSRAEKAEEEALIIVSGSVFTCTHELLRSSNPEVLRLACNMLENIAAYASLKHSVVELGVCEPLVALLSDTPEVDTVRATVKWWMPYRNRLDGRWPYGIRVTTVEVEDIVVEEVH
ncbi:hypothetical protein FB451DRAFT_1196679 [Mycena latifolia]|nr:hypothetical protein FB451DRAFT_1196679 [Mycena latifolia]